VRVSRDWRDDRIAELEAQVAQIPGLLKTIALLQERVRELEARLGMNSSNSNQPPSKDTPEQRRKRDKRKRSGRKRGAQPGHEPHGRELLPPEKVNRTKEHYPSECADCGAHLPKVADADALRHQVLDLALQPDVEEHVLHAVDCDECGHRTRAALPLGVSRGFLGPRLLALIGLLTGTFRVSRRNAVTLLSDVLALPLSLGALSEAEQRISEAVAPAVEEAIEFAQAQPVKHVDATSWSQAGQPRTLWTLSTTLVTVFAITLDGTRGAVQRLLGTMRGVLVSDRATVFLFWSMGCRQICWAHLLRKFAGFAQKRGAGRYIARELHATTQLMFHYWHRVRDGTMTRRAFAEWVAQVRSRTEWLLERGARLGVRGLSGSFADILAHREALWTFVDNTDVEPTNNRAERDLRPFVLWRKVSNGTQSARGDRYAERLMTVSSTLRLQRRSVFDYLHHACANALFHNPPPSLLPSTR
jgi:transposase